MGPVTHAKVCSMHVDHTSGVPLYVRVREKLRKELAQMEQGQAIPVEIELERKFGVSRITIRRAVEDLVSEGLLVRQQGRGTFVQSPKLTHQLNLITSWTEQLKRLGFVPRTAHRKVGREKPLAHIAEALNLEPGEYVIRIERVRLASREPISYMINYLPEKLVPGLMAHKPSDESLYEYLSSEYGLIPAMAVDTVGTRAATEEEVRALRIEHKAPVLSVRRLTYLEDGTPLEVAIVASRGDRYQYQVTVHGKAKGASPDLLERIFAHHQR